MNTIALGKWFGKYSRFFLKNAFNLKPKKISYNEMRAFLEKETKDQTLNYISLADNYFYVIDWETWKRIIEVDWTDHKKYIPDSYDCDNHAYSFASRMGEIYELNTAGVVHGQVNIGHFWNGIVALKDENLALYYYDPMREVYVKHEKGHPIIMKGWVYKPDSYRYF